MHSACAGPPPVAIGIATFPTNAPGANRSQNTLSNPLYVARYTGVLTATISADATDASASWTSAEVRRPSNASAGRAARSTSVVDAPASPNEVNTSSNTRLDFEAADGLPDTPTTEKRFEIKGPISTRTHHVRTTVPERAFACLWLIDSRQLGHRAWPPGRVVPSPCERLDRPAGRIIIVVRYTFPRLARQAATDSDGRSNRPNRNASAGSTKRLSAVDVTSQIGR